MQSNCAIAKYEEKKKVFGFCFFFLFYRVFSRVFLRRHGNRTLIYIWVTRFHAGGGGGGQEQEDKSVVVEKSQGRGG